MHRQKNNGKNKPYLYDFHSKIDQKSCKITTCDSRCLLSFIFHRNSYFPLRYIDNLIYLPRELLDGSCHPFRDLAEGGQAMVTYSDLFTFVIMLCAIITLVRDNKRKK
ncbi:hypothetical protein GCK47_16055 [Roseburia intestinalis]|uniref:Uncharacterized protein n=1 Tax=Roseburia intestinalis TaxID=166486 RepID=A0A6L6XKT2_9FIRM|nr:hypothetical protein [Roseburia intestinalis]DAV06189.1 MAG TPA: Membrane MotB of proton-channel complex MotA/MotB [Caudoviricetes sp.]DAY11383.1 MAG TPA: Membrane MotB of proton-channel complex MotA/MotB [Caudoviricetes sp.]